MGGRIVIANDFYHHYLHVSRCRSDLDLAPGAVSVRVQSAIHLNSTIVSDKDSLVCSIHPSAVRTGNCQGGIVHLMADDQE